MSSNFCAVNINIGPGDYEWFAISGEYSQSLGKLCKRNGFEMDNDNWWPRMDDFRKHQIPIYRFTQRPGDLVWVNSGTIYWLQAVGWCNNIHWNVGPLSVEQFSSALRTNEMNKYLFKKSDIPMVQLTWNIIINIHVILDDDLHRCILDILRRSLRYCTYIIELINNDENDGSLADDGNEFIKCQDLTGPTSAVFCTLCDCEIFNISFICKQDKMGVHCIECAKRYRLETSPSFNEHYNIEQKYSMAYLSKLYDSFNKVKEDLKNRLNN